MYGKAAGRLTSLYHALYSFGSGQAVSTHFVLCQKPVFEKMKACSTA
jgi:hypothetical protein